LILGLCVGLPIANPTWTAWIQPLLNPKLLWCKSISCSVGREAQSMYVILVVYPFEAYQIGLTLREGSERLGLNWPLGRGQRQLVSKYHPAGLFHPANQTFDKFELVASRPKKSPCFVAIFYNIEKRVILRALLPESWLKVTLFGFYTRNLPFSKIILLVWHPKSPFFGKWETFFSVGMLHRNWAFTIKNLNYSFYISV